MDERDFLLLLKSPPPRKDAEEFLGVLKTAGVKDLAARAVKSGVDFASKNKGPLIGSAIGGATAGGLQYLANRSKDGKPSIQRHHAEASLASRERAEADSKARGKEPGMLSELSTSGARHSVDVAKTMEKHPKKSALLAVPLGSSVGYGLGALARKLSR